MPSVAAARSDTAKPAADEARLPRLDANPAGAERAAGVRSAADVASIFDEIAPVYDRLGSILSLGLDGRWRTAAVESCGVQPGGAAIDVAAGTGKLAALLADRVGPFGRVVAVDFSPGMVERRAAETRDLVQLEFVLADALSLPYEDGRFDAATIAFGLGALPDLPAGVRELCRVVRPGGRVVCLEPTMPRPRWFGRLQHRMARRLAPLAVSVAARREAYRRLAVLAKNVPDADTLADVMRSAGLVEVGYRRLGLGAVALHTGSVPGPEAAA